MHTINESCMKIMHNILRKCWHNYINHDGVDFPRPEVENKKRSLFLRILSFSRTSYVSFSYLVQNKTQLFNTLWSAKRCKVQNDLYGISPLLNPCTFDQLVKFNTKVTCP
uniref:Uncharacterized protein n=1 Tax=Micrurus spixii TaxID=129469 RepID=A0A2D4M1X4_9SAUR